MSVDPLAFFAAEASSSSESEEAEDEREEEEEEVKEEKEGRLPSPSTLFARVGRPSFLGDPQETHINWDSFVKSPETTTEDDHSTVSGQYAAIPPPSSITEPAGARTEVQVHAAPVLYAKAESTSPDAVSASLAGTKHPHPPEGEVTGSKRAKCENFRQREKRKRDLGQSARGKSYVEEEKRILRQAFGKDEQ